MSPLVEAEEVSWSTAAGFRLGPATLHVGAGETVALIGANGAGKSTLVRILAGIWKAESGKVSWASLGSKPGAAALARRVGYLQQSLPGAIGLTVDEVVELGRFVHRRDAAADGHDVCSWALEQVGLAGFADRSIDALSGGERKRALLAAVLAQQAPLLVLDEPTAHLDAASHRLVAAAIRAYVEERPRARAAVVASHDLHFARAVADRVLGLADGRLVDLGPRRGAFAVERLQDLFATAFVEGGYGPPVVDLRAER